MAAARLARRAGMQVTIYDQSIRNEVFEQGFGSSFGAWDTTLLSGVDLVVASPGFAERSLPIVETIEAGLPIWSEIEFASRHIETPLVAITGTNGKTSVTEATSAMLEASGLNAAATGNIGAPLSDFAQDPFDVLVVEVSSFQLRFTEAFHPVAAGITNVAVDHLDWHGSPENYRAAKRRIYANQQPEDLLVFDADDEGATELAAGAPCRTYPISGIRVAAGGGGVDGSNISVGDVELDVEILSSSDPIHLANIASAAALSLEVGATTEGIERAAAGYRTGSHRREVVAVREGVEWIDDSKATNPHAALASIRAHGSVILIAGGLAKGIDVTPLAGEPNVKILLGIGEAGPELVEAADEVGRFAGTMDIAVEMAAQSAEPGDTVLLAPGCASFDQFESYAARGEAFKELVQERTGGWR